ncbi:MAG: GTPase, partial [Polyangia bacterium]
MSAMHEAKLSTPKGMRLHVGIFGRRNVGKSSLLNAMVRQHVSLVSDVAGTTTDPVEKPMELLPLGPVLFIDTAGIDDEGALGDLRVKRTTEVFDRTDLGLVVAAGEWGPFE